MDVSWRRFHDNGYFYVHSKITSHFVVRVIRAQYLSTPFKSLEIMFMPMSTPDYFKQSVRESASFIFLWPLAVVIMYIFPLIY